MAEVSDIPKTQRAALNMAPNKIEIRTDWPVVQPSELLAGQCLVRIEFSGVCHSDLHIMSGEWASRPPPLVGGHEGVGRIVAFGPGTLQTEEVKLGSRVGIRWTSFACGRCEQCRSGNETVCPNHENSGHTVHGTFCEYAVAWTHIVVPIPESLASDVAAPPLCAGLTVYRGLKESNAKAGDWVAIPGAGGGLGHMAVQFAVAMGLRVVAIDTGEGKRELSLKNGVEKWIDFKETKDVRAAVMVACDGLGPHAAVVTSPIGSVYDDALMYLRTSGTLVILAMPNEALKTPLTYLVLKNLKIHASAVGCLQDAVEALDFVARGKVTAHIQRRKLEELPDIYQEMTTGALVGRAVVQLS